MICVLDDLCVYYNLHKQFNFQTYFFHETERFYSQKFVNNKFSSISLTFYVGLYKYLQVSFGIMIPEVVMDHRL